MIDVNEVCRVLTGALMEILPEGGSVYIPKSDVQGSPMDEKFCVQVDARDSLHYVVRVVRMTDAQRRQASGRTEEALRGIVRGWSVKVWHYRACSVGTALRLTVQLTKWQAKRYGYQLESRGGETVVEIASPNGEYVFTGRAVCSPDDAYCRATGRVIALDRAVKQWQESADYGRVLDAQFDAAVAKLPPVTSEEDPDAEAAPPVPMDLLIAGGYPDGFGGAAGAQS